MGFDLAAALIEVQTQTPEQLDVATAYTWGSRAMACYLLFKQTRDVRWFLRAEDNRHEALEHAALASDQGATLRVIEQSIQPLRSRFETS